MWSLQAGVVIWFTGRLGFRIQVLQVSLGIRVLYGFHMAGRWLCPAWSLEGSEAVYVSFKV